MKYVFIALAVVAAVAALFFRPPLPARDPVPVAGQEIGAAISASPSAARAWRVRAAPRPIVVYVAGEVVSPGLYGLAPGSRVDAALKRAGGAKPDADLVAVNLAAPLDDGMEVAVPKIGAEASHGRRRAGPARDGHASRRGHGRRRHGAQPTPAPQSIDLNAAAEGDLETIPGIGPALAQRIIAYRDSNGPFTSVDELADIAGITPSLQDRLADYVMIRR
jgi:competence protein ComEA